jgi:flagellar biogenesis protein FliO
MGKWFDDAKGKAIATGASTSLAEASAGSATFLKFAIMPCIVLVVFTLLYIFRKKYQQQNKMQPSVNS